LLIFPTGEKFAVRGWNTAVGLEDESIVFSREISKVEVVPEREGFTIQVLAPELAIEMDPEGAATMTALK
jgi:hypothetical protein